MPHTESPVQRRMWNTCFHGIATDAVSNMGESQREDDGRNTSVHTGVRACGVRLLQGAGD